MDPPYFNPNAAGSPNYGYSLPQDQTQNELRGRGAASHQSHSQQQHIPRAAPSMPVQNNFDDFFNTMVNSAPPPNSTTVGRTATTNSDAFAAIGTGSMHSTTIAPATTMPSSNFHRIAMDMGFDSHAYQQPTNIAQQRMPITQPRPVSMQPVTSNFPTHAPATSAGFPTSQYAPPHPQQQPDSFSYQPNFTPQASGSAQYGVQNNTFNNDFSGNMSFMPNNNQAFRPLAQTPQMPSSLGAAAAGLTADFLAQPAAGMAMAYGQTFLSQGTDMMSKKFETLADATGLNKIRFYFAVDNAYVARKLVLLLFPFARRDWSLKYSVQQSADGQQRNQPVAPRFDVNCPDLYIPVMAIATFLLISGWCLGLANRFNPEQLSVQLSRSLAWLAFEVLAIMLVIYLASLKSKLSLIHIVIYSGYKYVAMSIVLLASIFIGDMGYWAATVYTGLSVAFFCIRSLRVYMLEEVTMAGNVGGSVQTLATKRRLWILLGISLFQPVMIYWLTRDLAYTGVLQSMAAVFAGGTGAAVGAKAAAKAGGNFLQGNILQKSMVP